MQRQGIPVGEVGLGRGGRLFLLGCAGPLDAGPGRLAQLLGRRAVQLVCQSIKGELGVRHDPEIDGEVLSDLVGVEVDVDNLGSRREHTG
jgi:hypothetical protein